MITVASHHDAPPPDEPSPEEPLPEAILFQLESLDPDRPARRWEQAALGAAVLLGSALLLFLNLGAYGLWSDEADTVLFARGVWQTGDTWSVQGDNVYLYRNGSLLRDLANRATPPLSYYLAAPFVGLAGDASWGVRLPFALCGLLGVGLLVAGCVATRASCLTWGMLTLVQLTCVPYFLYARQGRYYALAMLLSTLVVFLYVRHRGGFASRIGLVATGLALLATQYLNFAALAAALLVDYALWQRHTWRWSRREALIVGVPLALAAAGFALFWTMPSGWPPNGLVDRFVLVAWQLRDLVASEQATGLVWLAAPLLSLATGDPLLRRAPLALVVYVVTTALLSPQPVAATRVADVRYLAPLIPWNIWLVTHVLASVVRVGGAWSWPLIPLATLTNGLNTFLLAVPLVVSDGLSAMAHEMGRTTRLTPLAFYAEVAFPRPTVSREVSAWLREHVPSGGSVWVVPGEETYQHMAQAPHAIYAWQLDDDGSPRAPELSRLPDLHYFGRVPPDWIVVYGPFRHARRFVELLEQFDQAGHAYVEAVHIPLFWDDAIRPELGWHRFARHAQFDPMLAGVWILRRAVD